MRNALLTVACATLIAGTAGTAHADPVYINTGHYVIGATGDSYRFGVVRGVSSDIVFTGSATAVAGISALTCLVCDPGQTYDIGRHTQGSGFLGEADLGTATGTWPSMTVNYQMAGWLTFLADPITLPAWGTSSVSFAVPFRARVSLDGRDLDHPGGGIFTRWLGNGTAHVTFTPTGDGRWANTSGEMLRFEFSSQPVPEPATLFLIGTGLAGIAATRSKAQRGPTSTRTTPTRSPKRMSRTVTTADSPDDLMS